MTRLHHPHRKTPNPQHRNVAIISVVSNPVRFKSRFGLKANFDEYMDHELQGDPNVVHFTVEVAYGDRRHEVTSPTNPHHIQLRTAHELWHKENMINVAMQHAVRQYQNIEYFYWIDADIEFHRKDWLEETWHALQHHPFVQMFSDAIDLGPNGEIIQVHKGFCWCYETGQPFRSKYGPFWHPGFAWAARREAIDKLGGLLEMGILGAGDHHMALALIGKGEWSVPGKIHPNYKKSVMRWQSLAEQYIRGNIGYVPGTIIHFFHGKKKDRKYQERWAILEEHQYDPETDIVKDSQGLWQYTGNKPKLERAMRHYFRQRNEDSIDIE
jgi:hypothetical protein